MFQHFWPEKNCCDKCGTMENGAMLYISNVPVSFICEICDPKSRCEAVTFSLNVSNEEELNGWEWINT